YGLQAGRDSAVLPPHWSAPSPVCLVELISISVFCLDILRYYCSLKMRFLTQLSPQSVVRFGSSRRIVVSTTMEPLNCAVTTLLAFKGALSGYGAHAVHKSHIVNGHLAIETGPNRFKRQLVEDDNDF
ncbi:hypothetical protein XENOCAPTIV_018616, partial [Xenoophorus captivus]